MTIYLDTSLLVAAITAEQETALVHAWLEGRRSDVFFASDWTFTEVASALAIKLRTGQLQADQRANALAAFNRMSAESLQILPVTTSHFRVAARLVDQHSLGLRAGDALHLAVASECGAVVYTLDERMIRAGPALGIPVHRPS